MDTLVARYSRPAYQQNENLFSEHDQDDFNGDSVPSLSLKFAMPPVAHVCTPSPSLSPRSRRDLAC